MRKSPHSNCTSTQPLAFELGRVDELRHAESIGAPDALQKRTGAREVDLLGDVEDAVHEHTAFIDPY